jgi:[ribosomal protein S18]-alanine N-acetyltransferase
MNIEIRPMLADDIDSVHDLEQLIFKDPWSYIHLSSEADGEQYKHPFVLELDKKLIGYTFIWTIADEVHINNFAIHPAFRRKGLGLKLIRFIFDKFQEYNKYFLEVRKSNKAAINLYQKNGFNIIFTRVRYYADGEDALVMQKIIK